MSRWATMLGLGGLAGFFGVNALRLANQVMAMGDLPAFLDSFHLTATTMPAMADNEATAFAALFGALTIGAVTAIVSVSRAAAIDALRQGEALGAAVVTASVAFYGAAALIGAPAAAFFGDGPGFLAAMALVFAALLFDRLVEVEDEGADEAAFEAALRSIHSFEGEALRARWQAEGRLRHPTAWHDDRKRN